jgi:hypothetical protein
MSRGAIAAAVCVLLAANLVVLGLNVSHESRAAVAGMKSQDLAADPDFVKAVQSVVEKCKVNVDLANMQC